MFFSYQGLQIHYQTAGQGQQKPVLLLHGWGCKADTMALIQNNLALTRPVWALDFPGHGQSDLPKQAWSVGDFADMTKAFVEQMGLVGCDAVCHSFGGRVAIKLAAKHPSLFSKLVFTGAAGIRPPRGFGYYRRVYTFKLMKHCAKVPPIVWLFKLFGKDIKARIASAGSADYRALPEAMRGTFSRVVNEDLSPLLKHIRNATLLLWGANDQDTPLWMAQRMEKDIPDCGLVVFRDAGHYAFLDKFGDFIVIVNHFLNGGSP